MHTRDLTDQIKSAMGRISCSLDLSPVLVNILVVGCVSGSWGAKRSHSTVICPGNPGKGIIWHCILQNPPNLLLWISSVLLYPQRFNNQQHCMADGVLAQVFAHLLTSGLGLSNSRVIVSFWGLLQATKGRDSFSSALLCQIPDSCHLSPVSFSLSCLPTIHSYFPILQGILVRRQDKFRLSDV